MRIAMVTLDGRDELLQYDNPEPWFAQAVTSLLEGLATIPECEIHILNCLRRPLRTPANIAANIHLHSVLVPKWGWMRGAYVGCIMALRRKLREIQPNLVHGQGTERYCALAAVYSGFPNVITIHGNMRLIAKVNKARLFSYQWLAARLEALTLPRANGVICISDYTRLAVAPLAQKTWIIPNAADGAFFDVEPRPALPREIICVGHISIRKNQVKLIRALQPLAEQEKFTLIFYGGVDRTDPYFQEFFQLLEQTPWCRFAGFADRAGLRAALAKATMLVLPSLEDNCPMSVLEAMAAGVPIAAANVGGVPELITHDVDSVLFDPLKEDSIRAAIAELLADDSKRARLAANSKVRALERFHPRKVAEQHVAVYRQAIADSQSH